MFANNISLGSLIKRFWNRILLTWVLVILEGLAMVVMPLVIGWAVDGLMNQRFTGVYQLVGLAVFILLCGAGRRFYDTRAYAKIYRTVADELVEREQERDSSLSKISARTNLFTEFVNFLENSIPEIFHQFVNLAGTVIILVFIDLRVFLACLAAVAVTMLIYGLSNGIIFRLNAGQNDELEKQVDRLATRNREKIRDHFKSLMGWRIRLSDLETLNFSLIWIALAGVMLFTVITVTLSGRSTFGQIVSTVIYVFGFIESTMIFPLYYQQLIRLKEIAGRLAPDQGSDNPV
jgi:hypothetical protein